MFSRLLDDLNERVYIINEFLTFSLYTNVCRSLFEKHKLHFAFLLCARILMDQKRIDAHEWHFFLAGGSPLKVIHSVCFNSCLQMKLFRSCAG